MKQDTPTELRGLVIRKEPLDDIFAGKKTWEIRGSASKIRGRIALIEKGTGTVVGTCHLVEVRGPLKFSELKANAKRLNAKPSEITGGLPYKRTHAWVLAGARRLAKPVKYKHPSGAIIWVKLGSSVAAKLGRLRSKPRPRR